MWCLCIRDTTKTRCHRCGKGSPKNSCLSCGRKYHAKCHTKRQLKCFICTVTCAAAHISEDTTSGKEPEKSEDEQLCAANNGVPEDEEVIQPPELTELSFKCCKLHNKRRYCLCTNHIATMQMTMTMTRFV
ncbi:uncharacterized protein [Ptychodera flava]|uniref:uncharacterized protein isoform X2 n=1 Tax=Ptychodera flava TaxID=63121 RepID=UPI00396A2F50